jgi:hypothetical protein
MKRAALVLAAVAAAALPARAADYRAPLTAYGAPDLEGIWTNAWLTKLERPKDFTTIVVPEAEAAAYDKTHAGHVKDPKDDPIGQETSEFPEPGTQLARIRGFPRTSWIIEPSDGKVPNTEAVAAANKASMDAIETAFDDPEVRTLNDRCMGAGFAGPPISNGADANVLQIVQTRDQVAILSELNHNLRIIRLRGSHAPAAVRQWMGDSVGHWEGKTLVVETSNFHPLQVHAPGRPASDTRIVERFTRTGAGEITYEFRVENPDKYTMAWRGEMVLRASDKPLFEYACHEGNYGLEYILAGARQKEEAAARALASAGK